MKGSNSRFSHRPVKLFSNIAHVQGGMVTDADLTEAGQIHQARDETQTTLTLNSGSPQRQGIVRLSGGLPSLREGYVVAEGKIGQLFQPEGLDSASLFANQNDLPLGPPLPEKRAFLYADLWERPIFSLQDRDLSDAGLHGAETTYRTHTMTQIKAVSFEDDAALDDILLDYRNRRGLFATTGNARATVLPKDTTITVDDCDPCAAEVTIEATVSNALFRFEIIKVARDADGLPSSLTVAWSMENGSAIMDAAELEDVSARDAFARPGAVYEFFSEATEAQIGTFPPDHKAERPEFSDQLFPVAAPAPGFNGGDPFAYVRRWDGFANIDLTTRDVTDSTRLSAPAGKLSLSLEAFTLEIDTEKRRFLAGDYWLVELRHFAPEADRIRLVSERPHGITHHFCPLFEIDEGTGRPLSDADKRRLTFPALTDIPATHVAFEPECPDLFHNAENVSDALNALCDLDATEVAFEPGDDCERFAGTSTVDEALKRLCAIQDDTALTRMLRLMMDWGVVCGVSLSQVEPGNTIIQWTGGTMLDRAGRLIDVSPGKFDLQKLPPEQIHGPLDEIHKLEGEICLSLAAGEENQIEVHLSDRATAFGPSDPSYLEAVNNCIERRKRFDFGDFSGKLSPAQGAVLEKMINVWANRKTLEGAVPLTPQEATLAAQTNQILLAEYVAVATPERAKRVEGLIKSTETDLAPGDTRGAVRERRLMQLEATKLGIVANSQEEDRIACECENILTPCPPDADKAPFLVPVACIKTDSPRPDEVANLSEICTLCCRKQSMNWRSFRYMFGSALEDRIAATADRCCGEKNPPDRDVLDWIDRWDDDLYRPKPSPKPDLIPTHPLWPPKKIPDHVLNPGSPSLISPVPGRVFVVQPDVTRLPPESGIELLTGNGLNVAQTIDLDDVDDPLAKLDELRGITGVKLDNATAEPGDTVVMMTRAGKAVDYVVISKGSGRLPFETEAQTEARVEKIVAKIGGITPRDSAPTKPSKPAEPPRPDLPDLPIGDLDALEARLKELEARKDETESDLERLDKDIAASASELAQIEKDKELGLKDMKDALRALEEAQGQQDALILEMRREQPISVVTVEFPDARKILLDRGLVTLGQLADTPTATLTRLLQRTELNGSTLLKLVNEILKR